MLQNCKKNLLVLLYQHIFKQVAGHLVWVIRLCVIIFHYNTKLLLKVCRSNVRSYLIVFTLSHAYSFKFRTTIFHRPLHIRNVNRTVHYWIDCCKWNVIGQLIRTWFASIYIWTVIQLREMRKEDERWHDLTRADNGIQEQSSLSLLYQHTFE